MQKLLRMYLIKYKKDDAFTLIELIVVIIILGILAAVVLPSMMSQFAREDVENYFVVTRDSLRFQAQDGSTIFEGSVPTGDYRVLAKIDGGSGITLDVRDSSARRNVDGAMQKTQLFNNLTLTPNGKCIGLTTRGVQENRISVYPNIIIAEEVNCASTELDNISE